MACYSPLRISEGSGRDLAEALVRANYGLLVGKFDMDFDDGELRFQVAQILDGAAVGEAVIDRMICTAVRMRICVCQPCCRFYANKLAKQLLSGAIRGW